MIQNKQQQKVDSFGESGFTIIESLVALIVTGILLVAIAPVIVISTATRVQSRRVEMATQAAKTFIDGVRTGAITAPSKIIELDPPSEDKPRTEADNLITTTNMPVPTESKDLYCFNTNGQLSLPDCTSTLFYIQAAQIQVKDSSQPQDGYKLGLRIYRQDVDFKKTLTASESDTKATQRTFTNGVGDRQAPLIEMTTDIGSSSTSFNALCQRLGVASKKDCN